MARALKLVPWLFVPAALAAGRLNAEPAVVFVLSCLALLPLAGLMGQATEQIAQRLGPAAGGLFNASFGNAAELIIAGIALSKGLTVVVKASLTGSIIGNLLLVTGAAMFAGGLNRKTVKFSSAAAESHVAQLTLAVIGLLVPAIFYHAAEKAHHPELIGRVSVGVAGVLLLTYAAGLYFAFKTHKHLFNSAGEEAEHGQAWTTTRATVVLVAASALTAVVAELLVGTVEEVGRQWGMTEVFLGVILVAMVGNAAEHATAVLLARKGRMDTALQVTMQSSLQIALFVAPVLVLLSYPLGHPLDLVFSEIEIVAVMVAVAILVVTILNGETHWFEGFQLIAVYLILATAFYFLPAEPVTAIVPALAPKLP